MVSGEHWHNLSVPSTTVHMETETAESIPTVSEWGMIVLTFLLFLFSSVTFVFPAVVLLAAALLAVNLNLNRA